MSRKITKKDISEITRLREEGLSWDAMSKELNMSVNTVRKYCESESENTLQGTDVSSISNEINKDSEKLKQNINSCIQVLKEQADGPLKQWIQERLEEEYIWIDEFENYSINELCEFKDWVEDAELVQADVIALNKVRKSFESRGWDAESFVDWNTRASNLCAWFPSGGITYIESVAKFAKSKGWTAEALESNLNTFFKSLEQKDKINSEINQLMQLRVVQISEVSKLKKEIENLLIMRTLLNYCK